jgi:hypothetical protein
MAFPRAQIVSAIAIAAALMGVQGSAFASPSRVDAAFGNTILSTYPDGRQAELWLQPGGAYQAKGRRGDDSHGTWRIKSDRLCLSQHAPFPAPFAFCTPIPERMSSVWSARAVTGEHIRVSLVRGHFVGRIGPPH